MNAEDRKRFDELEARTAAASETMAAGIAALGIALEKLAESNERTAAAMAKFATLGDSIETMTAGLAGNQSAVIAHGRQIAKKVEEQRKKIEAARSGG
ncbi:MAG TPA: hypothetical protein PLN64_00945 [Candidatus Bipolaricaulis anaerobius]|nr:hypothetical protein [Candidatus Bipolaricaulis anaerobius]